MCTDKIEKRVFESLDTGENRPVKAFIFQLNQRKAKRSYSQVPRTVKQREDAIHVEVEFREDLAQNAQLHALCRLHYRSKTETTG